MREIRGNFSSTPACRSGRSGPPATKHRRAVRVGIIVSRFNEHFTEELLGGALDTLGRAGVGPSRIDVVRVPGSFEIPLIVKRLLKKKKYGALIALGVILRGETRHFNHVADAAARGILKASLDSDIPVINAVLACENESQAVARIGGKLGHKGRDAALQALEMADLLKRI